MRIGLTVIMLLAGCATTAPPAADGGANATLAEPNGRVVGRATVTQEGGGTRIRIETDGLAAGSYGVHIHRVGRCDAPSFESAGAHWNPTGQQHGFRNPSGRHRGDLPNLIVGAGGSGVLSFTVRGAMLRGETAILDVDGAAVMIHARPDDYRTDPSGNSGARIACGVLG
ncbi:MAG: superoxide dismutase family protein [Sphingomonas sp.]